MHAVFPQRNWLLVAQVWLKAGFWRFPFLLAVCAVALKKGLDLLKGCVLER